MMTLDCRLIKRQFDKPAVENYMVYGDHNLISGKSYCCENNLGAKKNQYIR